ncbi:MAG: DUF928 domain-containing protein [Geminicoccaceae bacterium]|jgi:hypothetical protein
MKKENFWIAALVAGLGQAALSLPAVADEQPKSESEQKIAESLEKIVFVPHDVGAPKVTEAGGVRGIGSAAKLQVLAPERLTLSLSPSPTLYWYVSKPTEAPVHFTLLSDDPNIAEPILDVDLGARSGPAIYSIPLAQYGVRLASKRQYSWSVTVSSEDGTLPEEPVSQTWLEHTPSAELDPFLATSSPFDQTVEFAANGYWYDAINMASRQIEAGDQSMPWREIRARLLDDAKLELAAKFDRQQSQ